MHNARLYKALQDYVQSSLALFRRSVGTDEDMPKRLMEEVEVVSPTSISSGYRDKADWGGLVARHRKALRALPAHETALRVMQEDKAVSRHLNATIGPPWSRWLVTSDQVLACFLIAILENQQTLKYQESVCNTKYEEYEEYLYRDTIRMRWVSPIEWYKMDTECIELGDGCKIIKIPPTLRIELLSNPVGHSFSDSYRRGLMFSECAFVCEKKVAKFSGEPKDQGTVVSMNDDGRGQVLDVCTALRLFKAGDLAVYNEILTVEFWANGGKTVMGLHEGQGGAYGKPYILAGEEVPRFLEWWQKYLQAKALERPRLEIAIRRFNYAHGRGSFEDRLIDQLIALEALLLKKTERQELDYRLALRAATLLGSNEQERREIFGDIRTAYRERSNVVHGGTIRGIMRCGEKAVRCDEFVFRIQEHLRVTIRKCLEDVSVKGGEILIDRLDDRIISGCERELGNGEW